MFQRRAFLFGAVGFVPHIGGFDHQQTRIGIIDDVANLLRGICVIDRGEHAAARHNGSVEHIPRVRGAAHERHTIALLQTVMHQALGDLANISKHLITGFGYPFAI